MVIAKMRIYESNEKDINLPELDILTFLFGEGICCTSFKEKT